MTCLRRFLHFRGVLQIEGLLYTVHKFEPVLICTIIILLPTVCIIGKIIYSIIILHVLCNLIYSFVLWLLLSTYIFIVVLNYYYY